MVLVFPGVLSHQQLQDHQETILLHFSPTTQPPFLQQQIFTLYTCTVLLQLSNTILYNHFYNSKVSPSTVLYTSSTNNPITLLPHYMQYTSNHFYNSKVSPSTPVQVYHFSSTTQPMFRIRIRIKICLLDPDPDPMEKCGSGSRR